MNYSILFIVGFVLLLVLLAIAALVIRLVSGLTKPFADGVTASGEIIGHQLLATGDGETAGRALFPVYRFVDQHGLVRTARDQIGDNGRLAVGTTMTISYRPQTPTRVRRVNESE